MIERRHKERRQGEQPIALRDRQIQMMHQAIQNIKQLRESAKLLLRQDGHSQSARQELEKMAWQAAAAEAHTRQTLEELTHQRPLEG